MGNSVEVRYTKKEYDLSKLKEGRCRVGFFATAKYADGISVASVARHNEFGTKSGVPARPFMRPAIHRNYENLVDLLHRKYTEAIRNNDDTMNVLVQFGMYCQGLIQEQIINTWEPPNAPSTIKRKGFNAPLRDTKVMLHSVSHQEEEVRQ